MYCIKNTFIVLQRFFFNKPIPIMFKKIFSIGFIFIVSQTFAQSEIDALRYTHLSYAGSARSLSMAGAFFKSDGRDHTRHAAISARRGPG